MLYDSADKVDLFTISVRDENHFGWVVFSKELLAGHKIGLKSAVDWVCSCLKGYKLPEPARRAHLAANLCRKNYQNEK